MLRTKQYTNDQRVFMVSRRTSGDCHKAIQFDFERTFPFSGRKPDRKTIVRNKRKFEREGKSLFLPMLFNVWVFIGTVHNLNKGRSGRKTSVLTPEKLVLMQEMIEGLVYFNQYIVLHFQSLSGEGDLPARVARSSCRKHRLPFVMSKSSFNRGTKKLGLHPYKLIVR